jgi:hypothetical protein
MRKRGECDAEVSHIFGGDREGRRREEKRTDRNRDDASLDRLNPSVKD